MGWLFLVVHWMFPVELRICERQMHIIVDKAGINIHAIVVNWWKICIIYMLLI